MVSVAIMTSLLYDVFISQPHCTVAARVGSREVPRYFVKQKEKLFSPRGRQKGNAQRLVLPAWHSSGCRLSRYVCWYKE